MARARRRRQASSLGVSLLLIVTAVLPAQLASGRSLAPDPFDAVEVQTGGRGESDHPTNASLTLRVYNYARIDPKSLEQSEKVASSIFGASGIKIVWEDCALTAAAVPELPACQSTLETIDLVARILPRRMSTKLLAVGEPIGLAQTCLESEPACELTVFEHRIDELARNGYRADLLLGHVLAHEIAHVLLGPGHSQTGILRAEWSRDDLQRISWGLTLRFSDRESTELRAAVRRRWTRTPAT